MKRPQEADAIGAARANYPALERWTYLDVAGRGVLSRSARAALDAHLDERMLNGADKQKFFELIENTRAGFARLIGAAPEEIAFTKNISEGLNMIATGFHWRRGDNVILCPELEHPNNI
jgi:selenocysteine lyase/cysteine desulfurase